MLRHQETTCIELTELHFDLNTLAKFRSFLNKKSCTIADRNSGFDAILITQLNDIF